MEKFLKTYNLPRLNHEEIENLNRLITSKENKLVTKILPRNKSPGPEGFADEFHKIFKEDLIPILFKLFQKIKEEGNQTHFTRSTLPQ